MSVDLAIDWFLPGAGPSSQVSRSVEYVQAGTTALVDAKKYQKGSRKLMCCILITVLIILGIIAGIVAWQVVTRRK